MKKLKVYTASKLNKADLWKKLRDEWTEIEFTARWPFLHVGTVPDAACYAKVFWQHDYQDVQRADVVLCFGDGDDKLRGALVEAGMAIAFGREVIVVGEHIDYGTWQHHPSVHRVPDLAAARMLLTCMAMEPS